MGTEKVMGTGTVYIMIAGLVFSVFNYAIHVGLARKFGPELYGIFGILMSLYLINTAFLSTGIPRALSKFVSETKEKTVSFLKTSVRLQLILALLIAFIYIIFAPVIGRILKDPSLIKYIAFIGIMTFPFSLIILYQNGYLNGMRLFKKQAIVIISHSILRVLFVFLLVLFGFKVFGALVGYFLASLAALLFAWWLSKGSNQSKNNWFKSKKIILFALPLITASVAFTLVKNINVLFIKSLLLDNSLAGLYTAAVTLSNIPHIIFVGLPLTLMPSISKSMAEGNLALAQKYISQSLRYLMLLLFPIIAIITALSTEILSLFYSSTYSAAGPTLSILSLSSAFLIISLTLLSIITGSGKPKFEMSINLIMILIICSLNFYFIPSLGIFGAALSSLITSFTAFVIAGVYVFKKFKILAEMKSFIRILISSGIIFVFALILDCSGIWLVINTVLLFVLYLLLLFAMKELKKEDLILLKRVLKLKG